MKRYCLALIVFLTMIPGLAYPGDKIDYTPIYGKGLYDVPMVMRIGFQNETGKAWYNVTERERLNFIVKWEDSKKKAIQNKKKSQKKEKREIKKTQGPKCLK